MAADGVFDREHEGMSGPPAARHLVDPLSRDAADARLRLDHGGEFRRLRKRRKVGRIEVTAGRERVRRRLLPAVLAQERRRGRVHVVLPGREQPHVLPATHVRANGLPGLVDLHGDAALREMRRGGEPDGAGADHRDRQLRGIDGFAHVSALAFLLRVGFGRDDAAFGEQFAGPAQQFSER